MLFKEIINSHNTLGENINIIKHVKGEAAAVLMGRLTQGVGQAGSARGEESVWTSQVVSVIPQDSPTAGTASAVPPELCTAGHSAQVPSALPAEAQDRAKDLSRVIFVCLRWAVGLWFLIST